MGRRGRSRYNRQEKYEPDTNANLTQSSHLVDVVRDTGPTADTLQPYSLHIVRYASCVI